MDEEKNFQYFSTLLYTFFIELLNVVKRKKVASLFVIVLVSFQVFCVYLIVDGVIEFGYKKRIMTTKLKLVSPTDLPVFTFCSKDQYRYQKKSVYSDLINYKVDFHALEMRSFKVTEFSLVKPIPQIQTG